MAEKTTHGTAKMDINTVTKEELAKLPFMNTQRAELIEHYRSTHGKFTDISQIDNVTGIGEKLAALVADYCEIK
jgi:competence protein ComEA